MSDVLERIDSKDIVVSPHAATSLMDVIGRAAADPTTNVDKLERLMAMYERIQSTQAKTAFDSALSIMQPQLPQVDRNGKIVVFSKADRDAGRTDGKPQQQTPYALWEDINAAIGPHLAGHGFALSFRTGTTPEGKITVTGVLSHKEGHREETTITLMHDSSGSKNSVQAVGSSISYGKRYTAGLLLNITSRAPGDADDDGKKAGGPEYVTAEQAENLLELIKKINKPNAAKTFLEYFKVESVFDLPEKEFARAVKALEAKVERS